jgi:hypothetical protein
VFVLASLGTSELQASWGLSKKIGNKEMRHLDILVFVFRQFADI